MIKRACFIVVFCMLLTPALAQWSLTEAASPYGNTSLTIATVAWADAIGEIAQGFTEKTGIAVDVVQIPGNQILEKTFLEVRSGGSSYDLFTFTYVRPYTEANLLPDLAPYLGDPELANPEWNQSDFVNFARYAEDPDAAGKIVGLPFGASGMVLYYRSDLFANNEYQTAFEAEYGYPLSPPTTLQELKDSAAFFDQVGFSSFSGNEGVGIALPGARSEALFWYFSFLAASEAQAAGEDVTGILDANNQPIFEPYSDAVMSDLQTLAEYAQAGYLQADDTAIRELFVDGGAAMTITWDSLVGRLSEGEIAGNWGLTRIPTRGLLGGWSLGLNPNSAKQEAAFLLAQYLTSSEADVAMFELEGRYPSRQSTYTSESYRAFNPYAEELSEAKAVAVPQVDNAATTQIIDTISESVSLMLAGQLSSEQAAERVNGNVENALFDAGY